MLLLSIASWASYYKHMLAIDGDRISIRTLLTQRQFGIHEIECLRWDAQRRRMVFHTKNFKAAFNPREYSRVDRLRIIRALRKLVPLELQEGWSMFCIKVALPLRDGTPSVALVDPAAKLVTITRRRYDRALLVALPLSIVTAVAIGFWKGMWEYCVLPLVLVGFWLLLRFNVPRAGRLEASLASAIPRTARIALVAMLLAPVVVIVVSHLLGVDPEFAGWLAVLGMWAMFPWVLYGVHIIEKQKRIRSELAAQGADELWRQGGE
jgi:hypothetical protein